MRLAYAGILLVSSVQGFAVCGFCGDFCEHSFPSQDAIATTFFEQAKMGKLSARDFKDVTFRYKDVDFKDVVTGERNYAQHEEVIADLTDSIIPFTLLQAYPFPQYCAEDADKSIFFVFDQFEYVTDDYQFKHCLQEIWRTDAVKGTCDHFIKGFEPIIEPQLGRELKGLDLSGPEDLDLEGQK